MSSAAPPTSTDVALRSVHTSNLPEMFNQLQISLVVSTYQAGKVILVRADGATLNTHFRAFGKPMGIAADPARLTVGGTNTVWYYRNVPAVAPKIEPLGKHDACYLPRRIHVTGDIDIHEMAYDRDGELWVVNTRFGCLCALDAEHSFYPRWRPPFVSAYAPEDRCHLNGLAMVEGRPKYVTALGETDTAGGWRAEALAQVKLPSAEELARTPAFHFQRGMALYKEGKLPEAIAAYRQCVALDPIFPNARYNLGVALGAMPGTTRRPSPGCGWRRRPSRSAPRPGTA